MKQLNEYDEVLKKPHPLFVYKNYINDIKFPTREIIKENSEHKIFAKQATMDLPEGDELFVSFCSQKYFESVLKEFKLFSKVRPKLFKKVIDGDYEFGKDVKVKAEYCINNARTYFDKEPNIREPENIFDLIIFGDDAVDFEIHELDMKGNDVNLQKIECEKNTAILFPFVPSSWHRQRIKEFDGKSVRISFIVDDSLQEINPKICSQRVQQKASILPKDEQVGEDLGIKREGIFDPWGTYLFDDYVNWDNYVELEKDFPSFEKVMQIHASGKDVDGKYDSVFASAFDERVVLSPIWQKFVKYHTSKFYFQDIFEKFDGIWKTWRPELREKIYSRDYTIGYMHSKKDTSESETPDIMYELLFTHDLECMNEHGLHVHVDRDDKVFQSMIYFRHPEDRCNDANLQLHHCHEWGNYFPGIVDKKVDYISNRSVTLPFTPKSYHSVSPGDRTGNPYTRKMVNIMFRISPDLRQLDGDFRR
jgi:hypothetical protein